jgi:hypothetical protein
MTRCSRCGAETLPHMGCCLACGFDADAEPRSISRQLDLVIGEATQGVALGDLLRVCAPEYPDVVPLLMKLRAFEIAVEARPAELAWLESACLALGATARVSDRFSADTPRRVVWEFSRSIPAKIGAALLLGGLGLALEVPLVTAASVAMILLLVWRSALFVEPRIRLDSANLQAACRPVDPILFARLNAVRKELTRPAVVALLDQCAAAFAELAWVLKSDGGLANRSLRAVESRLRHLVEGACALARVADREPAEAKPATPSTTTDGGPDALSLLATVRDRLVALRPTLAESRVEQRRREAVSDALDAIASVDAAIERALPGTLPAR